MTPPTTDTLDFEAPGPGSWARDPVHFPRPVSGYWIDTHPAPFQAGTEQMCRYYGLLLHRLESQYVNGFAYNTKHPAPDDEIPERFARARRCWPRRCGASSCASGTTR